MGLLAKLELTRTWPELERAAEHRFWDGMTLAFCAEPRPAGAVYLLGYVAEIVLMVACCRAYELDPNMESDHLRKLVSAKYTAGYEKDWGRKKRNDHEPRFWLYAFAQLRLGKRELVDPALLGAFQLQLALLETHWTESLRYRSFAPTEPELWEIVRTVEWVFENRQRLWS